METGRIKTSDEGVYFRWVNASKTSNKKIKCYYITYKNIDNKMNLIKKDIKESFVTGKIVVITGTLSRPRDAIKDILEAHGAKVTDSVTKKTDILVCGENAGSKLDKAKTLGTTVMSENELMEALS